MRSPNDPDYGHHDSRDPPAVRLVHAIIARAVHDLLGAVGSNVEGSALDVARRDALVFLTASSGAWGDSRQRLCDSVGLCPDALRERIIAILEGDDSALKSYDGGAFLNQVDTARTMWAERKRPPAVITARLPRIVYKEDVLPEARKPVRPKAHEIRSAIIDALRDGPKSIREIGWSIDGVCDSTVIRKHLMDAVADGIVERDSIYWKLRMNVAASDVVECSVVEPTPRNAAY